MTRGVAIRGAIVGVGLLAPLLFVAGASGAPRAITAILFLLFGPGLACVRLLRLDDPLTKLTLAVAVSLALETIVATALLATGYWSASAALAAMVAITLAAVAAGFARGRGADAPRA